MKPTFPIDDKLLAKKSRGAVLGSLLTWVSLLPTIGAWAIMDFSPLIWIPMGIATLAGLGFHWKKELHKKRPEWIREEVQKSNKEQDHLIIQHIKYFDKKDADWEKRTLIKALEHKQGIEQKLLETQPKMETWARIESLIDTLTFSMIEKLDLHRKSERPELRKSVEAALQQLSLTEVELEDMINPHLSSNHSPFPTEDKLTTTLRELQEEREIAQRVKSRMAESYGEESYGETTYGGSHGEVAE